MIKNCSFNFPDFTLHFNQNINYELFESSPDYYGIRFIFPKESIEVIHNSYMGDRLLLSNTDFISKDIPFSKSTEHFLPKSVRVAWSRK